MREEAEGRSDGVGGVGWDGPEALWGAQGALAPDGQKERLGGQPKILRFAQDDDGGGEAGVGFALG